MAISKSSYSHPLLKAILDARARNKHHIVAADNLKSGMSYDQLFLRSFVLSSYLKRILADQTYVGVLLPNTLAVLATFTSLQMLRKIPCMLNFSSGEANLLHACQITGVKTILTARAFIEQAKLEPVIAALGKHYKIVMLEDVRDKLSLADKISGMLKNKVPACALSKVLANTKPNAPAVILYTSGSEGMPKGVALSHENILANIQQVLARITFKKDDIVFNSLPVFHSFGLTVGMLMPLICALKTYLYPSPLHYKQIPGLVRESKASIMIGTDTFYQGYAKHAEPEDFANIWLAVAGAEKLKDSTYTLWKEKLGVEIMQGYGVTEASPVVACNIPGEHKLGSVGKTFPDIECRTEAVPGLEQGGRLFIRGPNVMLGYVNTNPAGSTSGSTGSCATASRFAGISDGWYDTGDIVDIDAEGYISILGRAKRFAKIAGEMVSLVVVEELAGSLKPDVGHAAVAVPDARKGEQIILYTEDATLTREMLIHQFKAKGVSEIALPREVIFMEAIPRLGSGKIDYVSLSKIAKG